LAGRVSHPLDGERSFLESSHPPFPFDQQGLVALHSYPGMKHTKLSSILVATDFSDGAECALRHGVALAKIHGAGVRLLHALHTPHPAAPLTEGVVLSERRRLAREKLDATAKRAAGHGVDVVTQLVEGKAADSVAEVAEESGADLVVAGSHGETGVVHALLGSVAAGIVRECACPVLTVRADMEPAAPRDILVPVDFSGHSLAAVEAAAALLDPGADGARLSLLHVFALPAGFYRFGTPAELPPTLANDCAELERELEELAGRLRELGFSVETHIRKGEPGAEIEEEARERCPNLIALGTHGRTGWRRLVLGSNAAYLLPRAPCPVLTVRCKNDDD
jgi:nucleotide-binding universal stress UspA family protein